MMQFKYSSLITASPLIIQLYLKCQPVAGIVNGQQVKFNNTDDAAWINMIRRPMSINQRRPPVIILQLQSRLYLHYS